jgi:hypothetical protein
MLNNRRMQKLNVDMPRSGMLLFALRNLPGKDCRQSGPCPLGVICKVHAFRMGGGGGLSNGNSEIRSLLAGAL